MIKPINTWHWLICPKCGELNDSDFVSTSIEYASKEPSTSEDFKLINGDVKFDCSCCDKELTIKDIEVKHDSEL